VHDRYGVGPDHPIRISPSAARVTVMLGSQVIASSMRALALHEASYPVVYYIPREDVRTDLLARSGHTTYCPYKGDCNYFSIPLGGERSVNAIWTYEAAYPAVAAIQDHLAFYPDRVDGIVEEA
jgi:uncharacterized protein (DUF427 family)